MKIQNVTKLTLSALVALQLLSIESVNAKLPAHSIVTLKTSNAEALRDPYLQVKAVKIRELTDEEALEFTHEDSSSEGASKELKSPDDPNIPPVPPTIGGLSGPVISVKSLDSIILIVEKLIAIGQKIAPLIKEGRAVITNNPMAVVSVLPRTEAKDAVLYDMGGWSVPVAKHYKVAFVNGFNSEVVTFVYSITYQYNGSVNGKGRYLTGIRASARNISISWGFDLDASSQLLQISNVGTQQDVVAGATLEMSYTVKNWTKNITTNTSFHITGDGRLYKLD
ncbi:MAG: hypothetical protein WC635_17750 [Bacteriovorax sp.]|jgi:hypothetical protein